jgi:hypothetical protein
MSDRWLLVSDVAGDGSLELVLDAGLRADRERIAELRRVARASLRRTAPPIRVRAPRGAWGLALGLAAAACVMVAFPMTAPRPDEVALVDVARAVRMDTPGFVATREAGVLMAAFAQQGIGPTLAMVGDLSPLGMALEGGMVAPGAREGTIAFYRTPDGVLWQCHMYQELGRGGQPVAERTVRGVSLRAFQEGDMSWVVWEEVGLVCVLAAQVSPDAVLAAVAAKIEAAHG